MSVNVPHLITTCPSISMMTGTTPFSLVKPWYDMFLAALFVQMKMSPLAVSKAIYLMSGRTQQLVWPNMVSGLRVAATRKMLLPFTPLLRKQYGRLLIHYTCIYCSYITCCLGSRSCMKQAINFELYYINHLLKKTFDLNFAVYGSTIFILIRVYSCGPTPCGWSHVLSTTVLNYFKFSSIISRLNFVLFPERNLLPPLLSACHGPCTADRLWGNRWCTCGRSRQSNYIATDTAHCHRKLNCRININHK